MLGIGAAALEFDKVREMLEVCTRTPLGRVLAAELQPLSDPDAINTAQTKLSAIKDILQDNNKFSFSGFREILPGFQSKPEEHSILEPNELYLFADAIRESLANKQMLDALIEEAPELMELAEMLMVPDYVAAEIFEAIDADGNILDEASPELKQLRKKIGQMRNSIISTLKQFFDQADYPNYVQDDFITVRGNRLVIPIKIEHRNRFKGIVHDRSRGGDSLFFEPSAAVELNNNFSNIQNEIRLEEIRILSRLTVGLYANWGNVLSAFGAMAELDLLCAKAEFAILSKATVPDFSAENQLRIISARHPLLDQRLTSIREKAGYLESAERQKPVVPMDILIGEHWDVLIITGPNAGGKTVSLKTAGLLCMMAQAGLQVPAKTFKSPVFQTIAADIGDAQDLIHHLSSFSSHLSWIKKTFETMKKPALILIDEIAAATDPSEGAALAMAVLEMLRDESALVIASTHLEALKAFAQSQNRMENACVEFEPASLKPTYKLSYGLPGKSNALETAKEIGLPASIVNRANYYMGDEGAKVSEIIANLQEQLTGLEEQRQRLSAKTEAMEKTRLHYLHRLDEAKTDAQKELHLIRKQWKEFKKEQDDGLREALAQIEELSIAREAERRISALKEERRKNFEKSRLSKQPGGQRQIENTPLLSGDKVNLVDFGQTAIVLKDWKPEEDTYVLVEAAGKRFLLNRGSLLKISGAGPRAENRGGVKINADYHPVRLELKLIGKTIEEATWETEQFLDEALLNHLTSVRIIHGRGTGKLRRAIHELLKRMTMVESWHYASQETGGNAVTVVNME